MKTPRNSGIGATSDRVNPGSRLSHLGDSRQYALLLGLVTGFGIFSLSGNALAVQQEQECRTDPVTQEQTCEMVGSSAPDLPTTDLERLEVNADRIFDPREQLNRWVYDSLFNGQNGPDLPEHPIGGAAVTSTSAENNSNACPSGDAPVAIANPILPATGNKIESELDFNSAGEFPLYLKRTYNKHNLRTGIFGRYWATNFDLGLYRSTNGEVINIHRDDGSRITYTRRESPSPGWFEEDSNSRIVSASGGGYVLHLPDHTVETYNVSGQITSQKNARGVGITFIYSSAKLISVEHTSGRTVSFGWTNGRLTKVIDPNGAEYSYGYVPWSPNGPIMVLGSATLPGTPSTTVSYHYELTHKPGALTGKSFNGIRYSTFEYD